MTLKQDHWSAVLTMLELLDQQRARLLGVLRLRARAIARPLSEVLAELGYRPMPVPPLIAEARRRIVAGAGGEDPIVRRALDQVRDMLGIPAKGN